jgi:poly(hydroxyalkanoate) depolymerase family esterase
MSHVADDGADRARVERVPAGSPPPTVDPPDRSAGRIISGVYTNAAGSRHYQLYVPGGYAGQPLPLIGMLHGCTQSTEDLAASTRMNLLAEARSFFVFYPQQATRDNQTTCWNWWRSTDQQRGVGEPSLIAGITRQIMTHYPVDPRRVYLAGMSAGGAFTTIMGATYPDLYAAIGVHSGLPYGAAQSIVSALLAMRGGQPGRPLPATRHIARASAAARVVPLILFQGDRDRMVHPANAGWVVQQWLAAYKALSGGQWVTVTAQRGKVPGGRAYTQALYRVADDHTLLEQWTIHEATHAWAGGSPRGRWSDPHGPDASAEMVRFFLQLPAAAN